MLAELKALHSPDIFDLENYKPETEEFSFLLEVMVGPKDMEGEESFGVEVCTSSWLGNTYDKSDIIIGRHFLIIREYNYERLLNFIKNYMRQCTGKTWDEVAGKVSRLGM